MMPAPACDEDTLIATNHHIPAKFKKAGCICWGVLLVLLALLVGIPLCVIYRSSTGAVALAALLTVAIVTVLCVMKHDKLLPLHMWNYCLCFTVSTPPVLDLDTYFPGHVRLSSPEVFPVLQQEILNCVKRQRIPKVQDTVFGKLDGQQDNLFGNDHAGWRVMAIKSGGKMIDAQRQFMPILTEILADMPELHNVVISVLDARKLIKRHDGYFKGYMRYHLGIQVHHPDQCVLCVNGERVHWHEGKGILFDDIFEHQVFNSSDQDRIVLFADVLRPLRNPVMRWLNKHFLHIMENHPIMKKIRQNQEQTISMA